MRKKGSSILLLLALLLALTACGGEETGGETAGGAEEEQTARTLTPVDPAEVPEDMTTFLNYFFPFYFDEAGTRAGEYHSDRAADGTSNILVTLAGEAPCVDYNLYPGTPPEYHWGDAGTDPRGWWTQTKSYAIYDRDQTEWIAQNIFHVSDEDLAALRQQGEEDGRFYVQDGMYYAAVAGIGDPFQQAYITQAVTDGQRYYLAYDIRWVNVNDGDYVDTRYAVMAQETIDGETYCTMYSHSCQAPEELAQAAAASPDQSQDTAAVTTEANAPVERSDWNTAYQDLIFHKGWLEMEKGEDLGEDPSAVVFLLHDMDGDGVPELLARNEVAAFGEMSNYVYTWDGDKVVFLGEIGFLGGALWESGTKDYPGLFHYAGRGDSYLGHYYDLQDGQIRQTLVSTDVMVPTGDGVSYESTIETEDADLYMTYSRTKGGSTLPMYTADEISAMSWESFAR